MSAVTSNQLLGQIIPAPDKQGFDKNATKQIASLHPAKNIICVWVASDNALKVGAAQKAVQAWSSKLFDTDIEVKAKGFAVSSDIDEQPHGKEYTKTYGEYAKLKAYEPVTAGNYDILDAYLRERNLNPLLLQNMGLQDIR